MTDKEIRELIRYNERVVKDAEKIAKIFSGSENDHRQKAHIQAVKRSKRAEKQSDCLKELLQLRENMETLKMYRKIFSKTFNRVMELESEKLIWEVRKLQEERK
jgi:hypothetical protein